ncbi:MAG: glucose-6-phosphate isomerase [Acidobacteriota bacterium]|nr:glucose-6-phosphate isomerase [Acidobacteriota bacterium]MDQ7087111.1 glucose-6-phosphate isomerase [Acidobacteriota bacterium]
MSGASTWQSFLDQSLAHEELGVWLDFSGLPAAERPDAALVERTRRALAEMAALEAGAIANPDEGRQVGHYWLRDPQLAPTAEQRNAIRQAQHQVREFAAAVREGTVAAPSGRPFGHLLIVGIGGSALGPQLAAAALGRCSDPLEMHFLDNTDPEGFEQVFSRLEGHLDRLLVVVVSKSGGTPETRNGLEETWRRLEGAGLKPPRHLVAVTGEGSALADRARVEGWLATFPMWDWVGGRTSQTSAVGLLPMALEGHDVEGFLAGAREMDRWTRSADPQANPAARMAMAWYGATGGRGRRDMVVIPYRDRLSLFARYLQQLVMESLGKEKDICGRVVRQGLTVYGNKGSTDQHAYVQQLRDGLDNYFLTLIATLEDPREADAGGPTAGDYLLGFLLGTRRALLDGGRRVITLVLRRIDAFSLGALIALYERSVGLYAGMIGINAYHQPGVEAGKKAAAGVLELQAALLEHIAARADRELDAAGWAEAVGRPEMAVEAHWLLEHLAACGRGVRRVPAHPAPRFRSTVD